MRSFVLQVVRTPTRYSQQTFMPARQGNIRAYSSIFEVFLKNIHKICPLCPTCKGRNGQDHLPARSLGPPDSLWTPSMTTLRQL
jgi:hypothetical protein